jgi:N-acetylglucosaminyl-diphospho-decaprenol L-rhamnosyltransferase
MISIILVNWNSGKQILKCIESISKYCVEISVEVIVIDNASTDNSAKILLDSNFFDLKFQLVINDKNCGFAAACNQGANLSSGDYYLFLNPDTELYEESLRVPLEYICENEDVGILGIQLVDENKNISRTCARFPTLQNLVIAMLGLSKISLFQKYSYLMTDWDHRSNRNVDQVIGAFFFVRKAVFNLLLGFDERFFVYYEEVDFSFRAKKLGWKTIYLSEARAFHSGGGTSYQIKATRLFYSLRSKILYGFKHFSILDASILFFCVLFIEFFTRIFYSFVKLSKSDFINTIEGYKMLYLDMYNIIFTTRK